MHEQHDGCGSARQASVGSVGLRRCGRQQGVTKQPLRLKPEPSRKVVHTSCWRCLKCLWTQVACSHACDSCSSSSGSGGSRCMCRLWCISGSVCNVAGLLLDLLGGLCRHLAVSNKDQVEPGGREGKLEGVRGDTRGHSSHTLAAYVHVANSHRDDSQVSRAESSDLVWRKGGRDGGTEAKPACITVAPGIQSTIGIHSNAMFTSRVCGANLCRSEVEQVVSHVLCSGHPCVIHIQ